MTSTVEPEHREERPDGSEPGLFWWAVGVCALTIVVSIGAPLIGRGTFIGTSVISTQLPWYMETPSSYVNKLPPVQDTVEIGAPQRTLIRETLVDHGRVALWDPFAAGGAPLGSQPNTGIFAPINWPILVLGVKLGTAWAGLLRLAVAALGMFFLLRRLGVERVAAVCGGLIYCTSGFLLSWNNWPQADVAAMLPLLFLITDRLFERRSALGVAAVAGVVAAMLLEGYPPLLIATFYALGGFLLVRWWEQSRSDAGDGVSLLTRLRDAFKPAWLLLAGVVLGLALAAFQLLPFLARLSAYDTSYRSTNVDRRFPASALLTSVFPWANGNPSRPGTHIPVDHLTNFSITEQFVFLGAAAVVFVLFALLAGPAKGVSKGAFRYSTAVAVLLLLVLFGQKLGPLPNVGASLRSALYKLPGIGEVPVHRLVALLLFFATLLAAFGIQSAVGANRSVLRFSWRRILSTGLLLALGAYLVALAVRDEERLTVPLKHIVHYGMIRAVAQQRYILESAIIPLVIVFATVLVIVLARRSDGMLRRVAIGVIPVLLAVEGLMATSTMLPRSPNRTFYPETASIRYLQTHLGHERIATTGLMLTFATNSVYRLRSVGGHTFTPPAWRQLFLTAGKGASSPTQLRLVENELDVAQAPALDRLSARYFVDAPGLTFGAYEFAPQTPRKVTIGNGVTASGTIAPGQLRAVVLSVLGINRIRDSLAYLDVTIRNPAGRAVAHGRRRLVTQGADNVYIIPIVGEHLPSDVPFTVEASVRSDRGDTAKLAATADRQLSVGVARPADDGLELVYADQGAIIYRRLSALPRVRWASQTLTVPNPIDRRKRLGTGVVKDDTVILSRPGPAASGQPADVDVTEDSGDLIRAEVNAQGAGYVVIADAIQDDWSATVDGRPVELRDADHALVAIPVPAGQHTIEVAATPRGWRTGIVVSLIAVLVLVVLIAWGLLRRRSTRSSPPSTA